MDDAKLKYYKSLGINTKTKAFKRYYNAGLLDNIDESYVKELKDFWRKNYGKEISPLLHIAFANLTGKKDVRVVPSKPQMWNEFIPFFNDMDIRVGYSDKNIYDKLVNTENTAKTFLKRVRGHYLNSENKLLDLNEVKLLLESLTEDVIIKPSNRDNGQGITKLKVKDGNLYLKDRIVTLDELGEIYGYNFIVQEVVQQHEVMAQPHPASVNTLRMVTLRWNNEIHHLLTYARIGVNNDVRDNSAAGGICVGVDDDGNFYDFAINKDLNVYKEHPSTGFKFSEMSSIPNYHKFIDFVKELHGDILHHDFVSWDIIVGKDAQPIFLEVNFRGPTWIYQLASQKPMFGNLTNEVLNYVGQEINSKNNRNSISDNTKLRKRLDKSRKRNEKLRKDVSDYKKTIKELKTDLAKYKKENETLKAKKTFFSSFRTSRKK